jgi:hypothetical protein
MGGSHRCLVRSADRLDADAAGLQHATATVRIADCGLWIADCGSRIGD